MAVARAKRIQVTQPQRTGAGSIRHLATPALWDPVALMA